MHPNKSDGQDTEDLSSPGVLLIAFQEGHWEDLSSSTWSWLSEQAGYSMFLLILSAMGLRGHGELRWDAQVGVSCPHVNNLTVMALSLLIPPHEDQNSRGDTPCCPHKTKKTEWELLWVTSLTTKITFR